MKQNKFIYMLSIAFSTSFVLLGPVIAFIALGYLINRFLNFGSVLLIAFGILGFICGLCLLYRMLMNSEKLK